MAESIVDKMWAGTKYAKDWTRNVAGGVYNTWAGITDAAFGGESGQKYGIVPMPVQAALSAVRQAGGGKSLPSVQNTGAATYVQELTGLPTQQPEPGQEAAFGFGRGIALPISPLATVGGGLTSALTQTYIKDPKLRAQIESLVPIAASVGAGFVQSARKGSLRDVGSPLATSIPMDKGRAVNNAVMMNDADMLASNAKTADRVNKIKQANASKTESTLRKFVDRSVKSGDPEAGKQAAIGWQKYTEKQESSLYKKGEEQFKAAIEIGQGRGVIPIKPVLVKLDELIEEFGSPMHGEVYQDVVKDLRARKAQFEGLTGPQREAAEARLASLRDLEQQRNAAGIPDKSLTKEISKVEKSLQPVEIVKVEELQSQLQTLGKLAYDKSSTAGHVYGQLKKSWDDALEQADTPAAEFLKKARTDYATDANKLKELKDQALSVFFTKGETGERIMVQPEQVMQKLRSLKPTEREFYVSVMQLQEPEAIKALRANIVGDLIDKGKVVGRSSRSAEFSPSKFLREFDKRKEDLEFLLPSKADREGFETVVADMRKASADPNIVRTGVVDATSVATGAAGMMTGKMGTQPIARGVLHTMENWLTDKDALVDLLYGTKTQSPTKTGRVFNALKEAAVTPYNTNRAMQGTVDAFQHESQIELPPPPEGFFNDDSKEELPPPPPGFFNSSVDMEKLLDVVAKVESNNNPNAVSPKGAIGMYQFMPPTAKQYGIDPKDPVQARQGAKQYLGDLMKQFDGDLDKTVAAYNWGPGNVSKHGLEKAPKETKDYINKVTAALMEEEQ